MSKQLWRAQLQPRSDAAGGAAATEHGAAFERSEPAAGELLSCHPPCPQLFHPQPHRSILARSNREVSCSQTR